MFRFQSQPLSEDEWKVILTYADSLLQGKSRPDAIALARKSIRPALDCTARLMEILKDPKVDLDSVKPCLEELQDLNIAQHKDVDSDLFYQDSKGSFRLLNSLETAKKFKLNHDTGVYGIELTGVIGFRSPSELQFAQLVARLYILSKVLKGDEDTNDAKELIKDLRKAASKDDVLKLLTGDIEPESASEAEELELLSINPDKIPPSWKKDRLAAILLDLDRGLTSSEVKAMTRKEIIEEIQDRIRVWREQDEKLRKAKEAEERERQVRSTERAAEERQRRLEQEEATRRAEAENQRLRDEEAQRLREEEEAERQRILEEERKAAEAEAQRDKERLQRAKEAQEAMERERQSQTAQKEAEERQRRLEQEEATRRAEAENQRLREEEAERQRILEEERKAAEAQRLRKEKEKEAEASPVEVKPITAERRKFYLELDEKRVGELKIYNQMKQDLLQLDKDAKIPKSAIELLRALKKRLGGAGSYSEASDERAQKVLPPPPPEKKKEDEEETTMEEERTPTLKDIREAEAIRKRIRLNKQQVLQDLAELDKLGRAGDAEKAAILLEQEKNPLQQQNWWDNFESQGKDNKELLERQLERLEAKDILRPNIDFFSNVLTAELLKKVIVGKIGVQSGAKNIMIGGIKKARKKIYPSAEESSIIIASRLEVIEQSPLYLNEDGSYDMDTISEELLDPLYSSLEDHWQTISSNGSWRPIFNRMRLNPEEFSSIQVPENWNRDQKTRYLHCLSNIAQVFHHMENVEEVPQELYDRCMAEWPNAAI